MPRRAPKDFMLDPGGRAPNSDAQGTWHPGTETPRHLLFPGPAPYVVSSPRTGGALLVDFLLFSGYVPAQGHVRYVPCVHSCPASATMTPSTPVVAHEIIPALAVDASTRCFLLVRSIKLHEQQRVSTYQQTDVLRRLRKVTACSRTARRRHERAREVRAVAATAVRGRPSLCIIASTVPAAEISIRARPDRYSES
jgi:hypothetical protein